MAGKDGYKKIKILIASPSDVSKERGIAEKVINGWNTRNSDDRKLILEAVLWESHSAPETGERTQGILNKQIVDTCDAAIGIFWTRIGTHTGVAPGGAVEEIERLEEKGKKVMLYFSRISMPRHGIDYGQVQKVDEFKSARQEKGDLTCEYNDLNEFERLLTHHLDLQIRRWFPELFKPDTTVKKRSKTVLSNQQAEEAYRKKLRNELNTVSLLGSSVIQPFPLQLKDIFVPLEMYGGSRSTESLEKCIVGSVEEMVSSHKPEHVMKETFRKCRTLLVIGDPGSGKTTLIKYYTLVCLKETPPVSLGFEDPVKVYYLPLRELERNKKGYKSLQSNLAAWSHRNNLNIKVGTFQEWLHSGSSLVLLDGLDEVSDTEERKEICRWIKQQHGLFEQARFVVTSRPTGYRKEEGIYLDFEHQPVAVKDFSHAQQVKFLNNWYQAALMYEIRPEGTSEEEWKEKQGEEATKLATAMIEYFNKPENKGVRELAAVPMLLQIMAILWKERKFLPNRRQDLYSAALDYLLEYRDRARDREPLLSAEDTRRVLAPVALWMQEVLCFDEADRKTMHEQMQQKLDILEGKHKAEELCQTLVDRAGILVGHGKKTYMFRHKTFREFLAGVQLKEEWFEPGRISMLVEHFGEESGWWDEVIKFFMAQSNEKVFDHFMRELFTSSASFDFSPKQKKLLAQVIEEAPEKRVDALCEALLNQMEKSTYRQRSILDSLKALNQAVALDDLRQFKKDGIALNQDINELAEDVIRSLEKAAGITRDDKKQTRVGKSKEEKSCEPDRLIRNPYEHDAQYILIRGGSYIYSDTEQNVSVPDLYVAKYPVTNKQYRSFIDFLAGSPSENGKDLPLKSYEEALNVLANSKEISVKGFDDYLKEERNLADRFRSGYDEDRKFNKDDQPVVGVSWYAARAYCLWLTMLAGDEAEYRLPTEVEWEWAAGGRRDKQDEVLEVYTYPWGDEPLPTAKHANYGENEGATTLVGSYPDGATPEGLCDMAGNVWEWTEDWHEKYKSRKVLRGGSWYFRPESLECSYRSNGNPGSRYDGLGFRVVRPSPPQKK